MALEDHAEHVEDLALGEFRAGNRPTTESPGRRPAGPRLDGDPVDLPHVEQLVEDAQPRLVRVVIAAVQAREEE